MLSMHKKIIINPQNSVALFELIILHCPNIIHLSRSQIGVTDITSNSHRNHINKNKTILDKKEKNNLVNSHFYYLPNIEKMYRFEHLHHKKKRDCVYLPSKCSLLVTAPKINTKNRLNISRGMKIKIIISHSTN